PSLASAHPPFLAKLVDDPGDQPLILALGHDPDHWLRAGFADHQPAGPAERGFARGDRRFDLVGLERGAAVEAHAFQELRERLEQVQQLAGRPVLGDQLGENLQARDQPVAGRAIFRKDDVPALLAADIIALAAHCLEHISVADLGALELQAEALDIALQPEVRHHRRDDAAPAQPAALLPGAADQGHQLVPAHRPALLLDTDTPGGTA